MVLEAKLRIDIASSANQLDLQCAEILLPPPKGIYLKTRLEPVLVDGNNYYVRRGTTTEPVIDVNLVNENIYDENNKLVIPKSYLLKKEKYLSNDSFMPYRAAKIIECMASNVVDLFVAYRNVGDHWHERINRHFRPECFDAGYPIHTLNEAENLANMVAYAERKQKLDEVMDEAYSARDSAFLPIKQEIELFLGTLNWHMYSVKLVDTQLEVERFCDYRVHLWEMEHGAKFRGEEPAVE